MQRISCAVEGAYVATRPRPVPKGNTVFVTIRAVGRCFRFVPNRKTRETIEYAFFAIAQKYADRIDIHEYLWMSNHLHIELTDHKGVLPAFVQDLNSYVARALNAMRGCRGDVFEKDQHSVVRVEHDDAGVEFAVYTLTNPVKANLVAHADHWKGLSSLDMEYGDVKVAHRPPHGLWKPGPRGRAGKKAKASGRDKYMGRSKFDETVQLRLVRPPIHLELTDEQLRDLIRERIKAKEQKLKRERKGKVVGWAKVKAQDFNASPESSEELFGRKPTVATRSQWAEREAEQRDRAWLEAYYDARDRFNDAPDDQKKDIIFPYGTWYMRQRHKVRCHPPPDH